MHQNTTEPDMMGGDTLNVELLLVRTFTLNNSLKYKCNKGKSMTAFLLF